MKVGDTMNEKIFYATMQILKCIQHEYNTTNESFDHDINVSFGTYETVIKYDDIQITINFSESE
jgi:hypothetical protein